jgi:cell division protein ZapE
MPQKSYQTLLDTNKLNPDPAQARVVDALQNLYDDILSHPIERKGFWQRFSTPQSLKGLYIYGGVGRGKTMLMDLFYEQLPPHIPKRRVHFHEFMIETHDYLHRERGKKMDHLLPTYAAEVVQSCRVLCFDEFHVTDVADAMILGRLFQSLLEEGIVIITTSNRPPDELYKGGLQRDRFEPFVDLIKRQMSILHLDSATDYRQNSDEDVLKTKYYTPLGHASRRWANRLFINLTGGTPPKTEVLIVKGRSLEIDAAAGNTARLSFATLCEQPIGAEDYLAIAARYKTILLENIPKLGYDRRNEAKRFITLIDVLYDQKITLYITADAPPDKLYRGTDHGFEFDRTVSRLIEMSS